MTDRALRGWLSPALLLLLLTTPPPADATPAMDPEKVARVYLDAVESMRWGQAVDAVHPEALASFRSWLEVVLFPRMDPWTPPEDQPPEAQAPRGEVMEAVVGATSLEDYRRLSDAQVLLRAFHALQTDSPGLVNAWVDRSTQVLGVVTEGDRAYVVYRLEWRLQGATPDTELLSLSRTAEGAWKVVESRELGSLPPALGAILLRLRQGPPPG